MENKRGKVGHREAQSYPAILKESKKNVKRAKRAESRSTQRGPRIQIEKTWKVSSGAGVCDKYPTF